MAPPKLKLTYFDGPGRAEAIRLAFQLGKIEFTDNRISFSEWPALKPNTPTGYLPILEVDGVVYAESTAILMYACRLAKLTPSDSVIQLRNSSITHALLDFWPPIGAIVFASDADKPGLAQKASEELLPKVFTNVERIVADGQDASGFTCGSSPVAADLSIFSLVEACVASRYGLNMPNFASQYPALKKVHTAVSQLPVVKAYLGK